MFKSSGPSRRRTGRSKCVTHNVPIEDCRFCSWQNFCWDEEHIKKHGDKCWAPRKHQFCLGCKQAQQSASKLKFGAPGQQETQGGAQAQAQIQMPAPMPQVPAPVSMPQVPAPISVPQVPAPVSVPGSAPLQQDDFEAIADGFWR